MKLTVIVTAVVSLLYQIQPLPVKLCAVLRRVKQTVNKFLVSLVGVRGIIPMECSNILGRGEQSSLIKSQSANQYSGR